MFEKLQQIHTKPGTVATLDNYGKSAVKHSISDHNKPKK